MTTYYDTLRGGLSTVIRATDDPEDGEGVAWYAGKRAYSPGETLDQVLMKMWVLVISQDNMQ